MTGTNGALNLLMYATFYRFEGVIVGGCDELYEEAHRRYTSEVQIMPRVDYMYDSLLKLVKEVLRSSPANDTEPGMVEEVVNTLEDTIKSQMKACRDRYTD